MVRSGRVRTMFGVVALIGGSWALVAGPGASAGTGSESVAVALPTGPWVVPAGVSCATFVVTGASGGAGAVIDGGTPVLAAPGGLGGVVTATVPVHGTLTITIGSRGTDGLGAGAGLGGSPGGGDGAVGTLGFIAGTYGGGGGGGLSSVVSGPTPLVVAGGGGGGGFAGSITVGGAGGSSESGSAANGADGVGVFNTPANYFPGLGGHSGATDALGGAGGAGPDAGGQAGTNGGPGTGGDGGMVGNGTFVPPFGGGGGGSGAVGGGGGGGGGDNAFWVGSGGGGAGSSSVAPSGTGVTRTTATDPGDGSVVATYTPGDRSCGARDGDADHAEDPDHASAPVIPAALQVAPTFTG